MRWKPTHSVLEMSPRSQLTQRLLQYVTLCDFVDRHQHFRIIMLLPSSERLKSLFRLAFLAHANEYSPSPHPKAQIDPFTETRFSVPQNQKVQQESHSHLTCTVIIDFKATCLELFKVPTGFISLRKSPAR